MQAARTSTTLNAFYMAGDEEEPAAKKAKTEEDAPTGWEDYTLNAAEALMKAKEGMHFADIESIEDLQDMIVLQEEIYESI